MISSQNQPATQKQIIILDNDNNDTIDESVVKNIE